MTKTKAAAGVAVVLPVVFVAAVKPVLTNAAEEKNYNQGHYGLDVP